MTHDPIITISVWHGTQSALAARLGIPPSHMAALVKRRGLKRSGCVEIPIQSPTALRTLRHSLAVADEDA